MSDGALFAWFIGLFATAAIIIGIICCCYRLEQIYRQLIGISHLLALNATPTNSKPAPPPIPKA